LDYLSQYDRSAPQHVAQHHSPNLLDKELGLHHPFELKFKKGLSIKILLENYKVGPPILDKLDSLSQKTDEE